MLKGGLETIYAASSVVKSSLTLISKVTDTGQSKPLAKAFTDNLERTEATPPDGAAKRMAPPQNDEMGPTVAFTETVYPPGTDLEDYENSVAIARGCITVTVAKKGCGSGNCSGAKGGLRFAKFVSDWIWNWPTMEEDGQGSAKKHRAGA